MMLKKKSNPWARMKYLYVLPMAAIAVAAFARPEVSSELNEISSVKVSDFVADIKAQKEKKLSDSADEVATTVSDTLQQKKEDKVYYVVDEIPEYPGGTQELMKFLGKNIQYPAEAKDKKIAGRVIVQFVVNKDGSTSDFKVIRAIHPLLDAEALRVLKMMPKWKPGMQRGEAVNVKFTIPVSFALQKSNDPAVSNSVHLQADSAALRDKTLKGHVRTVVISQEGSKENSMIVGGNPLILLDGKETTMNDPAVKNLPTEQIESVTVLKDSSRIAAYGEKAKDGVMIITTKKK